MTSTDLNARNTWRKSRRSVGNGACVEVAAAAEKVMVRDSANPAGRVIRYSPQAWRAFLSAAKRGKFDKSD